MLIKYDPRDLSRIFVRRPDGSYIEARYRNLAYPAVTIWEWRNAKRRLFERGKRQLSRLLKKSPRLRDRVIGGGFFHSWLGCAADGLGCGH
jgi:hypothetical protein